MMRFTKKVFDGRGRPKKQVNSANYFCNVQKLIRHLVDKLSRKLPKFNTILGVTTILVALFVVEKMLYLTVSSNVNKREALSEISVLKDYLLHQETFDKIASMLMIYDAEVKNNPLEFIRLGKDYDGGYVVPVAAVESADVLMGYGIADDISFEREFSRRFNKPSFGFDCGVQSIDTGNSKCHFFSECIGNSNYLYGGQKSSERISSFSQQLQRLGLTNKKVFVKMDIEGAEFDVLDDVLNYVGDITGIVLEIHIPNSNPEKALNILSSLNRHFVLVHVHGNNCSNDYFETKYSSHFIPKVLELTYINRNLLSFYKISSNQKHPQPIDQPNSPKLPECEFEIIRQKPVISKYHAKHDDPSIGERKTGEFLMDYG